MPEVCRRLTGITGQGELLRGNWVLVKDGCVRARVPVLKRMLRSDIEMVKSREASVTEALEALTYDTSTMQRWLLQDDDADMADCILSRIVYLAGPEATGDVIIDCEFATSDDSERAVRATGALMIPRPTGSPIVA